MIFKNDTYERWDEWHFVKTVKVPPMLLHFEEKLFTYGEAFDVNVLASLTRIKVDATLPYPALGQCKICIDVQDRRHMFPCSAFDRPVPEYRVVKREDGEEFVAVELKAFDLALPLGVLAGERVHATLVFDGDPVQEEGHTITITFSGQRGMRYDSGVKYSATGRELGAPVLQALKAQPEPKPGIKLKLDE